MRLSLAFVIAVIPSVAFAQAPDNAARKKETLQWVMNLQDPSGGFYAAPPEADAKTKPAPSLRATSSAVRVIKYLGGEIPHKDKHAAFVLTCFDAKTGGFAEPGGAADVAITSIGVMAAVELSIPKEKYTKAMDYLKEHAKTFEEVRIGAAAVEAWGVKDCPFDFKPWLKVPFASTNSATEIFAAMLNPKDGGARYLGSIIAMQLRLEEKNDDKKELEALLEGQRDDGGWGKRDEKSSDIETTYRVMRALMLLKVSPKNVPALRKFIESHHNKDGGYGAKPGDKSSVGGVYYSVVVTKWLNEMEK